MLMNDSRRLVAVTFGYMTGVLAFPWLHDAHLGTAYGLLLRVLLAALLPTLALTISWAATSAFGRVQQRPSDEMSAATLRSILHAVTCFVVTLHLILLFTLLLVPYGSIVPARLVLVLLGLLLVFVGNCLPRIRPNLAVGIRTSLMLRNRRAWARLHRHIGYVLVLVGVLLVWAAVALGGDVMRSVIATIAIGALIAGLLSYREASRA